MSRLDRVLFAVLVAVVLALLSSDAWLRQLWRVVEREVPSLSIPPMTISGLASAESRAVVVSSSTTTSTTVVVSSSVVPRVAPAQPTRVPSSVPVSVASDVQEGEGNWCRLSDGVVWCWGWRTGPGASSSDVPVRVPLENVTQLSVGRGHICAATKDDVARIYCWGDNFLEGVGFDGKHFADAPVLMWEGRHVHSLDAGYRQTRAHVGFVDGGCGWISWGEIDGRVIVRP
jgi:hypothetical protein